MSVIWKIPNEQGESGLPDAIKKQKTFCGHAGALLSGEFEKSGPTPSEGDAVATATTAA